MSRKFSFGKYALKTSFSDPECRILHNFWDDLWKDHQCASGIGSQYWAIRQTTTRCCEQIVVQMYPGNIVEIEVLALKKLYSCDGSDNYLNSYGSVGRNHHRCTRHEHKRSVAERQISLIGTRQPTQDTRIPSCLHLCSCPSSVFPSKQRFIPTPITSEPPSLLKAFVACS